jgi:hypothetical protein
MTRRLLITGGFVAAALLAGCGGADTAGLPTAPGIAIGEPAPGAMCAAGEPDCQDTALPPADDGGAAGGTCLAGDPNCQDDPSRDGDAFPVELHRSTARELLGADEAALPDDVRVGRRGGEQFALTEDYVLGRMTVELDEQSGTYVVTAVTVELPDGPETFTS